MQVLPQIQECCPTACPDATSQGPPGSQGDDGAAGAAGTNGVNAYTTAANNNPAAQSVMPFPIQIISTTLTAGSVIATMASTTNVRAGMRVSGTGIPASTTVVSVDTALQITLSLQATANGAQSVTYRDQVTVNTTTSTAFLTVGEIAFVQSWGYMLVLSIPSAASVQLENIQDASLGTYADNSSQGDTLAATSAIVPGGLQGVTGVTTGALLIANNLSDVGSAATARTNLGLGTASVLTQAQVFLTSNELSEGVAATKRTNLGLGSMALQAAGAVAITGGAVNGTLGATTPGTAAVTTLTTTSTANIGGSATLVGRLFGPSTAIQSLLTATAVVANGFCIRVVGNGGAVSLTATPTITTPAADGQFVLIRGTSDVNTVTFVNRATLIGSKLALGAATRVLGDGDQLLLAWDATSDFWYEVAFTNI